MFDTTPKLDKRGFFLRLTSIWNLKLSINILNTVILKPTGLFGTLDLLPTHGIEIPY